MSANTYFGRLAGFPKGGVVIAHTRSLSVKANAEIIKVRSNDDTKPVKTMIGEKTYTLNIERLFTGKALLAELEAGSSFDIVFNPDGKDDNTDRETWEECIITSIERKIAEGVIENVTIEASSVTFPT